MGCFLCMTERDFAQLTSSMLAGSSVVGLGSGWVGIQVHGTVAQTIGQLAANIRNSYPTTRISNPTEITYLTLAEVSPNLANSWLKSEVRQTAIEFGKTEAQQIAAEIYQKGGFTIDNITNSTGVDISARHSGHNFSIEVKSTSTDKSIGQLLGEGYGFRQCSDPWLEKVGVNPGETTVNGIIINTVTETVSFWQRVDSDAKDWRCICRDIPLQDALQNQKQK